MDEEEQIAWAEAEALRLRQHCESARGLIEEAPFEVRARLEAATDLMEQVEVLLDLDDVLPAAAVMLAGAALEEALRGLFESEGLELPGRARPSIDSYASALRRIERISKGQKRDIDSCAGLRNAAAHGEFDKVQLPNAQLMAQQVNLLLSQLGS